jgi:hypothetical protein
VVSAFKDLSPPEETFDTRAVRDGPPLARSRHADDKGCRRLRPDGSLAVISTPHIAGVTEDFFVMVHRRYERFDRRAPRDYGYPRPPKYQQAPMNSTNLCASVRPSSAPTSGSRML